MKKMVRSFYSLFPLKYRMGRKYWQIKKFLCEAQAWNREKIKKWQLQKLKHVLYHAYTNVPGYYFLYKDKSVKPDDIRGISDIKYLPFVTKELIRDNLEDFSIRTIANRKRIYVTTGGSTGIPFGFYHTRLNRFMENAFMHVGWERAGWRLRDSSAVLRGAFVGTKTKFWHYDHLRRELLLSSYYLNEETYSKYIGKILKYTPSHLQAYPSSMNILSNLILANSDAGKVNFKIILLGSENIYDWQKDRISKAFPEARIFGWYGHAEQVILAPMCEYSDKYHVWPFYGLTEIIDAENQEVKLGQEGELVGTSFWNYATPFIRYKSMDFAKKGTDTCEKCGRQFQLLDKIKGRLQEMIVTRNGRYISIAAINMHSDIFDHVMQFQFYQEKKGEVIFNVVRKETYSERDTEYIKRGLHKKLGNDTKLKIRFVNNIPHTQSGKYRFLIQKLALEFGDCK